MSLAVSGTNLFAGTYGGGVFLSTNNGTSWTAVNTGLTNTDVYALAVSRHESLCRDLWRRRLSFHQQRHKLDCGQYRLDEHLCQCSCRLRHESLCRDLWRRRLSFHQQRHKLDCGQYRLDEHLCLCSCRLAARISLPGLMAAASFFPPTTAQAGLRSIPA